MKCINGLLSNTVLFAALYSWFIAQLLKITIEIVKKTRLKSKELIFRAIFGTGGMPSSHSATIASVAISIGIKEGFNSSLFALAIVLVIIVIRDATGVRLSTGKQAVIINELLENQYKHHKIEFKRLKEVKGHTPLETFVGVILGVIVSLGVHFNYLKDLFLQ